MKTGTTILLSILFVSQVSANFYEQLCEFNFNWEKYAGRINEEKKRDFTSDKEYVQAHLESVLEILKSNPVSQLTCEQFDSRMKLIEILSEYREAGKFPINYHCSNRIPVFIDENGTYCAVGYLLKETGFDDVAKCIAETDNYVWVKDINHPAISEWQKKSGFTLEEIKLIQGAYDSYPFNGLYLPNKHEIPQKPEPIVMYFEDSRGRALEKKKENIWLKGESENGVLQGRWEQNYAVGIPWIVGYYENGKRSGQWEEYYQGTKLLCRTENWRNDKLNGIRKRFDKEGKIIEEILFKDGNAITKTNYDFVDSLIYIRKPLDSNLVQTQIFTFGGGLIAAGQEIVHNPGGLKWFQNIELTALNSAQFTEQSFSLTNGSNSSHDYSNDAYLSRSHGHGMLFQTPPLVEYKKEGNWIYYSDYVSSSNKNSKGKKTISNAEEILSTNFSHFGQELFYSISMFESLKITKGYDSISVFYIDNTLLDFYGYGNKDYAHLKINYFECDSISSNSYYPFFSIVDYTYYPERGWVESSQKLIKNIGQYNSQNQKIGVWKHYDEMGVLYKKEEFIVPKDEIELTQR